MRNEGRYRTQIECQHLYSVPVPAEQSVRTGKIAHCPDCGVWLNYVPYTFEPTFPDTCIQLKGHATQ